MGSNGLVQAAAGDLIFREGEVGNLMYVLLEGTVELKMKVEGAETVLKTINQVNDFFGEMALIDGRPRSASAVAVTACKLLPVDGPTFENMILTNGKFALKIIKVLSDRLRRSNDQMEELMETSPKERIAYGMADFALKCREQIHDGSYKVHGEEMKAWINSRMGIGADEIDAALFRYLKNGVAVYASSKSKEYLLLGERFVRDHDRRR